MTASVRNPSEEQFAALSSGVTLCYQTFGNPADEPMLLVMGLGGYWAAQDPDATRRFELLTVLLFAAMGWLYFVQLRPRAPEAPAQTTDSR